MVSLSPPTLPPVSPVLPSAGPQPVTLPAQVVATSLPSQPVRELTLLITAATVTAAPQPVTVPPVTPPSSILPAAATTATPTEVLLLNLQTPQGTVQIALPATAPNLPLTNLDVAGWQKLLNTGGVQIQLAPMPAALLQRLPTASAPPLLAQLVIPPRALAVLAPPAALSIQPPPQTLSILPTSVTATLLPPALAESYRVRFVATIAPVAESGVAGNPLQKAAAFVRGWIEGFKPAVTATQPPVEQTLTAPPAAKQLVDSAPRQVTVTLIDRHTTPLLPPAAGEITARLLGLAASGDQLIETDDGQLLLAPARLLLVPGRPVTLRIDSLLAGSTLPSAPAPALADQFPGLHDSLEGLAVAAPALAMRLAGQLLLQPATSSGLAPPLLFLLAAIGIAPTNKPAATALNPALRTALAALDEDRTASLSGGTTLPSLVERLLTDLQRLSDGRSVTDGDGEAWHGYTLPTQLGETLPQPVALYIQQPQPWADRQAPQDRAAAPPKQTRFIVDMRLSRLGTTQLEGLSRLRQLDLTLRTQTPLPAMAQQALSARWTEIAAATGLTGQLQFGAGKWFTPREPGAIPLDARL